MSASRGARRPQNDIQRRVAELERTTGIPHNYAVQVVTEQRTLNEVLQLLALQDQVEGLMRRHNLNRALATQVAKGHASLEHILRKQRMAAHKEQHYERSVLDERVGGEAVGVALHGRRQVLGELSAVDRYEFEIRGADGAEERIHKLQLKYLYAASDAKRLRRLIRQDRAISDAPREPIPRPQDRYTCSDRRLFGYLDQGTQVRATTLEGDLLRGHVSWMGRYEFGLRLKGGIEVIFFRHALADLNEA